MLDVLAIFLLVTPTVATPIADFPFNSQIPPIAVVSTPYSFQFAPTTFSSSDSTPLTYTLHNAPTWLRLDSSSRTLLGTPSPEDVGSPSFGLEATDGSGSVSTEIILEVAPTTNVQAPQSITAQLAKAGTLSGPTTLAFYTGESFSIVFNGDTFQGSTGLSYAATSADRSPLPSWVAFDPVSLTFSGLTPPLTAIPQTFGITLIASTIPGFADASTSFDIIINDHRLAFVRPRFVAAFKNGAVSLDTFFTSSLLLDGQAVPGDLLQNTSADAGPGLSYHPDTRALTGQTPQGQSSRDVLINAQDQYGDIAEAVVHLSFSASLFTRKITVPDLKIGRSFSHQFSRSLFSQSDVDVTINLGADSGWIKFDSSSLTLHGTVPDDLSPKTMDATMSATSDGVTETQDFGIRVIRATPKTVATSVRHKASKSSTSSTSTPNPTVYFVPGAQAEKQKSKNSGVIAGVVIGVLVALSILAWVLWCCWQRRRRKKGPPKGKPSITVPKRPGGQNLGNISEEHSFQSARPAPNASTRHAAPPRALDATARAGNSAGKTRYQSGNSVLRPSEETALHDMNETTDGTHGLHTRHPSYGPSDILRATNDDSQPKASRFRLSQVSPPSTVLSSEGYTVGLGHGRSSYQSASQDLAASLRSSTHFSRLSRLSGGLGSGKSQHTFAFAPYHKRRSRNGETSKHSIRLVPAEEDDGDFTQKYDTYIRKRASNKRKSNPLFAGHAANLSSQQPSSIRLSSTFRKKLRQRESESSSVGAAPVYPRHGHEAAGLSHGDSERSSDWTDAVSSVYDHGDLSEEDLQSEGSREWNHEADPIVAAKRQGHASQWARTRSVDRSASEKMSRPQTSPTMGGGEEGLDELRRSSARSGKAFI